jgi:UDP-N-acetylglucosamine--dolichyl-phosphate N-acetylglucosaminephosphotransferase
MIPLSDLNWSFLEIIYLLVIFLIGFGTTYFILPYIIKFMKKKKYVGYDIHKNSRPEIAESGGLSFVIGFIIASSFLIIFFPVFLEEIVIFLITVLLAAIIGFIDDRVKFKSRYKILLSIFSGTAIFIANLFNYISISSPTFPILDQTRLNVIYPFLIPILIAIFANTVNMLEGYNGEGSGTCLIAVCFLFICAIIWNSAEGVIFSIPVIAVLIPFFLYNKYPAKTFPGDIGTLSMGAMIACIMLFGSLEVAAFTALLIHIFNSFYVIYSVRGFLESDKIREGKDDIILLEDDRIKASDQKGAALTLPRLILARGPLKEPELVKNFLVISTICGTFAILSVLFTQLTAGIINIGIFIIVFVFLMIPVAYLLKLFPRIRGIIVLMIILLIAGITFFLLVEYVILPFPFAEIKLGVIIIPVDLIIIFILGIFGLIGWYYITIKYFWTQINKMKVEAQKKN